MNTRACKICIIMLLFALVITSFPLSPKLVFAAADTKEFLYYNNIAETSSREGSGSVQRFLNRSKEVKSEIKSDLNNLNASKASLLAASTEESPIPKYSYVNTKGDEAPFSIQSGNETISTLSGSLSIQAADFSLPGRNGLGFTLSRRYDSSGSQFGQMVTYDGETNSITQPIEELNFPIGKGWTWDVPYIEGGGDNKYLHLGTSGTYKISFNGTLLGYPWKDLKLAQTNITVNGQQVTHVLTSIQLVRYYFNGGGKLIQIADAYENVINFNYALTPPYGQVLTSVTDAIGNTITISYSQESVVLTKGHQTVTLKKVVQDGKELLSQVIDPLGRITTYDYAIKQAQFTVFSNIPGENPYALLTGITYPTGAKSKYVYEDQPIWRYIGKTETTPEQNENYQSNQSYRISSREDQYEVILGEDTSIVTANRRSFSYTGDMGSTWDADIPSFSTTIDNGLSTTVIMHKKDYIDKDTPAAFYNINQVATATKNAVQYTNTTNYTYDEVNRYPEPLTTQVTKSASNTGATLTLSTSQSFDAYGNVTHSQDVLGNETTYTYDAASHLLTGILKPIDSGKKQYLEYIRDPARGTITASRVRDGSATGTILQETLQGAFDAYGNPTETKFLKEAGNYITVNTEYDPNPPYAGAFPTRQSVVVRDAEGRSSTIVKEFTYEPDSGRLKSYKDGNLNQMWYEYDLFGRVTKAIQPDSSFITLRYHDDTNQVEQRDETGVTTRTTWNPFGWKTELELLDEGIYRTKGRYGYDQFGRVVWTEDALQNRTLYSYDPWSRQDSITFPDGAVARVDYDDISRIKTTTDPEGYGVRESYDALGRVIQKEQQQNLQAAWVKQASFSYDLAGNVLSITDNQTEPNTTHYGYDLLNRLTQIKVKASVTDTNGAVTVNDQLTGYQYDHLGNLTQVTYPDGSTTRKRYDEVSRLIGTTDAKGITESFYYDANSNMVKVRDRGDKWFKNTFDARDRLIKREMVDGNEQPLDGEESISFTFDAAGRRLSMTDQTGITSYFYHGVTGALRQVTYPDGKKLSLNYDATGNRISMNDPFGINTYYKYDSRNRLSDVSSSTDTERDSEAKYQYYGNSLLKQITQGNGVSSAFSYEGLRLQSLKEQKPDGTVVQSFQYTYDNNGNQKTKAENGVTYSFGYDELNRIQTSNQFQETYGFDVRGNRTFMKTNATFERPDAVTTFDQQNRLTQVTTGDGKTIAYRYNGDGQLWERTENGETTRYYWDGNQIIGEATVAGGVATQKARYIRGQGLIAREDGNGKAYYLHNGHGDVIGLMSARDEAGRVSELNAYSYDIFGNVIEARENVPQPFGYSGEYWDSAAGLQYLRARWYDPGIGRFISEDTYEGDITNPLSLNLYTYVYNNPLRYWDPTGHITADDFGGSGGLATPFGGYAGSPSDKGLISALLALMFPFYSPAPAQEPTIIPQDNPMGNDPYISQQGTEFENRAIIIPQNPTVENQPYIDSINFRENSLEVLTSHNQELSNIAGKYGNLKCVEAANSMRDYMIKNGMEGAQVSIKYKSGGFVVSDSYGNEAISLNGFHTGILYDGMVYDNIHPNGLPYQDWLDDIYGSGKRDITTEKIGN